MLNTTNSPEGIRAFKPNPTCFGEAFLLITQVILMPALSPALLSFYYSARGRSGSAVLLGWCPTAAGQFSCS